jgi:hypothetical protein
VNRPTGNTSVTGRPASRLLQSLLVLLVLWPGIVSAQSRLLPVDQAASVPDFLRFRTQLKDALARRDAAAVLAVVSPDIKLSFGGDEGFAAFKTLWRPESPDSPLWETLSTVLSLGGTFAGDGTFTAPYVFANWPQDKDAFTFVAAIRPGVRVRRAPDSRAAVVATLDYTIVELLDPSAPDPTWSKIKTPDGKIGFVDARMVRSPIDYRVRFEKIDGHWRMTFFLAGD